MIRPALVAIITVISWSAFAAPKIIGDNSDEVKKHADLKPKASAYIDKVDKEVSRIIGMSKQQPTSHEIAAQSRKMNALADEGDPLGSFPDSPLYQCRAAGISARTMWSAMIGMIPTQTPQQAHDDYRKLAKECRQQLAKAPEAKVTVETPETERMPPFPGCLSVVSINKSGPNTWTCPKKNIPR